MGPLWPRVRSSRSGPGSVPRLPQPFGEAFGKEGKDVKDGGLAAAVGAEEDGERSDVLSLQVVQRAVVLHAERLDARHDLRRSGGAGHGGFSKGVSWGQSTASNKRRRPVRPPPLPRRRRGRSVLRGGRGGRQTGDLETVVVLAELAAAQHRLGDLLQRQIREGVGRAGERLAADQQRAAVADLVAQADQAGVGERLRGGVDEVALGRRRPAASSRSGWGRR